MKYQRILVPFDGSDHAEGAFTTAREFGSSVRNGRNLCSNIVPMALASSHYRRNRPYHRRSSAFIDQESYTAMVDTATREHQKRN